MAVGRLALGILNETDVHPRTWLHAETRPLHAPRDSNSAARNRQRPTPVQDLVPRRHLLQPQDPQSTYTLARRRAAWCPSGVEGQAQDIHTQPQHKSRSHPNTESSVRRMRRGRRTGRAWSTPGICTCVCGRGANGRSEGRGVRRWTRCGLGRGQSPARAEELLWRGVVAGHAPIQPLAPAAQLRF